MKRKLITLILAVVFVFSLSANAFGEGDIPNTGRNCGLPDLPPCPVAAPQPEEGTYYKTVFDILI